MALAFQLAFEVLYFVLFELPRWAWRRLRFASVARDVQRVLSAEEAIAGLVEQGIPYAAASVAVVAGMQRHNAVAALIDMGVPKAEASRIVTMALRPPKPNK
jgi:hypothetical protein